MKTIAFHLPQFHPTKHGYSHFFGFLAGGTEPMNPTLEVDGKLLKTGQNYPLLPLTSLGRSPTNSVPIEDNFASGEHAVLARRSDQWWLEDRRSRNGTTLNGENLFEPTYLRSGDRLNLGGGAENPRASRGSSTTCARAIWSPDRVRRGMR